MSIISIPIETWQKLCDLIKVPYLDPDAVISKVDEILESVTIGDDGTVYIKTPKFDVQFPMIQDNEKDVAQAKQYLKSLGFNR